MNKNLLIYLTFIGLFGLLFSCEKDETKVVMSASPIVPTITTMPDLTLKRAKGNDTLVFVGTAVDPGFQASATYFLDACAKGNDFKDAIVLTSDRRPTALKITVSEINGFLLKKFPADQVSSVDFRIRSVLAVDAGTGALGTGTNPLQYVSATKTADVTVYGLPRLDLIGSGLTQKIESSLGDGKYAGFVKLDKTKPFTLKDPDANMVYGNTGGKLAVNGAGITPGDNGWFKLTADTKALTYATDAYMIGVIGSATPNSWNSPDSKMDYDAQSGTWRITMDLKPSLDNGVMKSEIKFRLNDGWAWNLGGTPDKLIVDAGNLTVSAGNYTIVLTITNPNAVKGEVAGTCTITKN